MSKSHSLTKEDILHLAKLASLSLNDAEVEKIQGQFDETLKKIENLNELDTSKVAGSASSTQFDNVYFADGQENTRGLTEEQTFQNTTAKKDSLFKVTRIL